MPSSHTREHPHAMAWTPHAVAFAGFAPVPGVESATNAQGLRANAAAVAAVAALVWWALELAGLERTLRQVAFARPAAISAPLASREAWAHQHVDAPPHPTPSPTFRPDPQSDETAPDDGDHPPDSGARPTIPPPRPLENAPPNARDEGLRLRLDAAESRKVTPPTPRHEPPALDESDEPQGAAAPPLGPALAPAPWPIVTPPGRASSCPLSNTSQTPPSPPRLPISTPLAVERSESDRHPIATADPSSLPPALPSPIGTTVEAETLRRDLFEIDAARRSARRLGRQGRWEEAWVVMKRLADAWASRMERFDAPPAATGSTSALDRAPIRPDPLREAMVGTWRDLGVIAGHRRAWDESRVWLERASRVEPLSASLRYDLALIERASGRPDAARAHIRDAMNLLKRPDLTDPRDPAEREALRRALEHHLLRNPPLD